MYCIVFRQGQKGKLKNRITEIKSINSPKKIINLLRFLCENRECFYYFSFMCEKFFRKEILEMRKRYVIVKYLNTKDIKVYL